jgi:alanyl-tRNA synthetase
VIPGNKEQGYVLRRLIRRAIVYGRKIKLDHIGFFTNKIAEPVFKIYSDYKELKDNKDKIMKILFEEENKFNGTLIKGLEILKEIIENKKEFSGKNAFLLYQSYGFPLEMTLEMLKEKNIKINSEKIKKEFYNEQSKHQNLSRTASSGKFKSGLADSSLETTKLHTATHMLNAALKIVLNNSEIHQRGSNITPERLRFDFSFNRKLTEEEIRKVEELINKKIKDSLKVTKEEMPLKEALKSGAEGEFGAKYPEKVSVYTIIDPSEKKGYFSKEICTGPHILNTKELGKFKILKEDSSSAGIRRIKAVLE